MMWTASALAWLVGVAYAADDVSPSFAHLPRVQIPIELVAAERPPVVLAVIDDGFRTSHEALADVWWSRGERAGNLIDEDGNGLVDDVHGWDVADNDADVSPQPQSLAELYHGTDVASVAVEVVRHAYGADAPKVVGLMGIKAIEDAYQRTAISHGFLGIKHAVEHGANVVLCAWGVNKITADERAILDDATARGVMIVASAGNFANDVPQYPAAHPGVLSVASLGDGDALLPQSNFGGFIDLAAPGLAIDGADVSSDTARKAHDGTSSSAAIVAGAAVVLSYAHPEWSVAERTAALLNTATPLQTSDSLYGASLGAGRMNLTAALSADPWLHDPLKRRAAGAIPLTPSRREAVGTLIMSPGLVHHLTLALQPVDGKLGGRVPTMSVYAGKSARDEQVWTGPLGSLAAPLVVPGNVAYVELSKGNARTYRSLLRFHAEPVNLSTRYCTGIVDIDEPIVLNDGSGDAPYSPGTDCRWVFTAPEGKVIHFAFEPFDTEPVTDFVYLFNGPTGAGKIMAVFSGPNNPPEYTSWTNQAMLWFVTNRGDERQGWTANVTFVDAPERSGAE